MNVNICKDKKLCTGCTACANICPEGCIKMETDSEGFLYPVIDTETCVDCKLCIDTCPVNNIPEKHSIKKGYVVRYNEPNILQESTSGGFCTAVADYIFSQNGVLFGAGYNKEKQVIHFGIQKDEKTRISEIRGSKYVQSDLGDSFSQIKRFLDDDRWVGFIGTPCQVAGLRAYLKKDYEKLLTVDLVCHGVASPYFFKEYLDYLEKKYNSKPTDIRFRNKTYGYHSGTMTIEFENGKKYSGSGRVDPMLKAYFAGSCSRYSCYTCPFRGEKRFGDFTAFDCWHFEELVKEEKDDDKGYNNVFINTRKGEEILFKMSDNLIVYEADVQSMKCLDGALIDNDPKMSPYRDKVIKEINHSGFFRAMRMYIPVNLKNKIIERIKIIAYKTYLLKPLKRIKNR